MNSSSPIRPDPFGQSLGVELLAGARRLFYTDSVMRGKCRWESSTRGKLSTLFWSVIPCGSPSLPVLGSAPEAKPLIISIICINISTLLSQSEAGDQTMFQDDVFPSGRRVDFLMLPLLSVLSVLSSSIPRQLTRFDISARGRRPVVKQRILGQSRVISYQSRTTGLVLDRN